MPADHVCRKQEKVLPSQKRCWGQATQPHENPTEPQAPQLDREAFEGGPARTQPNQTLTKGTWNLSIDSVRVFLFPCGTCLGGPNPSKRSFSYVKKTEFTPLELVLKEIPPGQTLQELPRRE